MIIDKKQIWVLIVLLLINLIIFIDTSILPVSLPTIQKLLHSSDTELQWMINSYLLSFSVFVMIGGKVADVYGHRKLFNLGLYIFGIFSLLCALSYTSMQLIVFRFFQGIGAAIMIPPSAAILCENFSFNIRGRMIGTVSSAGALGYMIGPFVGGIITQYLSWHYIFLVNIPIIIISIIFSYLFIKKSPKINEKIDYFGFLLFFVGFSCLTMALMQGKEWGWTSYPILLFFVLATLFLINLLFHSRKKENPFLDLALFKNRTFLFSLISIFAISFSRSIAFFWVIYFQNVLDFSPTYAGALEMIAGIPLLFLATLAGKMCDKYGAKISIISGQALVILCLLILIFFLPLGNVFIIGFSIVLFGSGIVLIMVSSFNSGLSSVKSSSKVATASGTINTFRNLGGSLGIAILGLVLFNSQSFIFSKSLLKNESTKSLNPNVYEGLLSNTQTSIKALHKLSTSVQNQIVTMLKNSFSYGICLANIVAALAIGISLFLILYFFKGHKKEKHYISPEP